MADKGLRIFVNEVIDFIGDSHRLLEESGHEISYGRPTWVEPSRPMTEDEMIEASQEMDAIMGASRERYTRRFMEACPRIRVISKYGIGTEKIDVAAASQLGILVTNTPVPENYHSVAEHTIALILASRRRLKAMEKFMLAGGWRGPETPVDDLEGTTVGLIGFGRIAREVASRLAPWGVHLVAYDPYLEPEAGRRLGVRLVSLEELLETSDVVSVHTVVTDETRKLLDDARLRLMKPSAHLVNTSRGEIIDEAALYAALTEGRLAGAALDVFDPEPPRPDSPLLSLDSVIVSPHVAGFSRRTLRAITVAATENLLAALQGEAPKYTKNPDVLPAWRERLAQLDAVMPA